MCSAQVAQAPAIRVVRTAQLIGSSSPYPGLRPFQPDDFEYFFGREAQVREVVLRLKEKRFVAVIGGSGSGKSSLILAGAIPRLRAFAIKAAGDFWVPVVATPGTNHVGDQTPIVRLARKFCAELLNGGTPGLVEECVGILRSSGGLGMLVEKFGRKLRDSDGVDLSHPQVKVNFLFLIDQFEELFHPSNSTGVVAQDCAHLVNRIIEQFKNPHPQICVALTMRSEHLNDCTRYPDLPDAINAASYLVKRLDESQLRQAIRLPALRFLQHRAEEGGSPEFQSEEDAGSEDDSTWPNEVQFDERIINRLLADSRAVLDQQDHADHLPLLQHLLFWLWMAACIRCEGRPVPDRITLDDLRRAVCLDESVPFQDDDNTLTLCLENHCTAIFNAGNECRSQWAQVFRGLAFKDPNTGTYTQLRASMASLVSRLHLADDAALKRCLAPWLSPHIYLHWDADSMTVKVAHETLIRRWTQLRNWTDEEDRQFQTYIRLLEDCDGWLQGSTGLAPGDAIRRYEDAGLFSALRTPDTLERFKQLLDMDRDGPRLANAAPRALEFLEESKAHHEKLALERKQNEELQKRNQEKMARAQRDTRVFIVATVVLAVALIYLTTEAFLARKERTFLQSYVLATETLLGFQPQFRTFDAPQLPLRNSLAAAHIYSAGESSSVGPAKYWPVSRLYGSRLSEVQSESLSSETKAVGALRSILRGVPWPVKREIGVATTVMHHGCAEATFNDGPRVRSATFCAAPLGKGGEGLAFSKDQGVISIYAATRAKDGTYGIGPLLISTPPALDVSVAVASDMSNLVFDFPAYYQFYALVWTDPERPQLRVRGIIEKSERSDKAQGKVEKPEVIGGISILRSAPWAFATDVKLENKVIRLFDVDITPISSGIDQLGFPLAVANESSRCHRLVTERGNFQPRDLVWELNEANGLGLVYCVHSFVANGVQGTSAHLATLYRFNAHMPSGGKETPILGNVVLDRSVDAIRIDAEAGWLAFQTGGQWHAVPWKLDLWRGMARTVFAPDRAKDTEGAQYRIPYELIVTQGIVRPEEELLGELPEVPTPLLNLLLRRR